MAQYQIDNIASPIDWQEDDLLKRTLQNAKNILMCRMGEVPYDRYLGMNPKVLEEPITEIDGDLLPELDRAMTWEPDAEIVDAEARLLPNGQVYVKAILDIKIGEEE